MRIDWSDDIHTNFLEQLRIAQCRRNHLLYFVIWKLCPRVYRQTYLQRISRKKQNGGVDNATKEFGGLYTCLVLKWSFFSIWKVVWSIAIQSWWSEQWSDTLVVLDFLDMILCALTDGFVKKWEACFGECIVSELHPCYLVTGVSLQGFEALKKFGMRLMNLERHGSLEWIWILAIGHTLFFYLCLVFMVSWVYVIETFGFGINLVVGHFIFWFLGLVLVVG